MNSTCFPRKNSHKIVYISIFVYTTELKDKLGSENVNQEVFDQISREVGGIKGLWNIRGRILEEMIIYD